MPFPQFELQAKWIAQVLSGAAADVAADVTARDRTIRDGGDDVEGPAADLIGWGGLPSRSDMAADAAAFEAGLESNSVPRRHAHQMVGGGPHATHAYDGGDAGDQLLLCRTYRCDAATCVRAHVDVALSSEMSSMSVTVKSSCRSVR